MTEPIDQATKLPPLPWVYTEDKREEMFSIHTEGQDPIDCDNRFIVCGIWYQSCGRKHGKAIADFIIDSANTTRAEKLREKEEKHKCFEGIKPGLLDKPINFEVVNLRRQLKQERNKAIDEFYNMMDKELQTEPINRARYMNRLFEFKEFLKRQKS